MSITTADMSRPGTTRAASTNLVGSDHSRPLEGKLAIVTGSSRGIGAATARYLAGKGCAVVLNYASEGSTAAAAALAKELQDRYGVQVQVVQADMGAPTGPAHIVAMAKNHFSHPKTGAFQIDIIVNNAGIAKTAAVGNIDPEDFNRLYAVNVLGPLLLMGAALPYLPHDRSGRVVNVSSVSSSAGLKEQSVYGGTKAALEAMTRTWARELAERATVNAVNPGPVATDMYGSVGDDFEHMMRPFVMNAPLQAVREGVDSTQVVEHGKQFGGRPAYEHEIAGVIGMLCTTESAWCTGSVVCANGGFKFST